MSQIDPTFSLITSSLLVVSAVFPILATVAVGLRLYVRRLKTQPLGWDDWTIIISLFLWVNEIMFSLVLGTVKISVLLFYQRIFKTRAFLLVSWLMVGIISGWTIAITLVSVFKTWPVWGIWTDPENTYVIDDNIYAISVAAMSLGFDVMVLAMPLTVIRTLQMSFRRKVAVMVMFWLGSVACIALAVRLDILRKAIYTATANPNAYHALTEAFHWAELEPNAAVLAASLPMMRPLFTKDGKSGESIFASLRGRFSLSSRSCQTRSRDVYYSNHATQSIPHTKVASHDSQVRLYDSIELA